MNLIKRNGGLFPTLANDLLDDDFLAPFSWNRYNNLLSRSAQLPPANIKETKDAYQVELSVPGFTNKDFKIDLEDGLLTISCEKKDESNEDKENYKRREFSYSSFTRSFQLPDNVSEDKIQAKYDNGMLHISVPKKNGGDQKPKKSIEVA